MSENMGLAEGIHRVTVTQFLRMSCFPPFLGQALRNVCCSDVSRRHFFNKIATVRTFS